MRKKKGKTTTAQKPRGRKGSYVASMTEVCRVKGSKIGQRSKTSKTKSQLMQRLMEVGGPCVTLKDVDKLINLQKKGTKPLLNALKDQVRYQKMVLLRNGKLRLTASLPELIQSLKDHLDKHLLT